MQENILRSPRIAEKRTESAYKALHRKAVSVIAVEIIVAEIALMLCFCAAAATDGRYLLSAVITMADLAIISALSERKINHENIQRTEKCSERQSG